MQVRFQPRCDEGEVPEYRRQHENECGLKDDADEKEPLLPWKQLEEREREALETAVLLHLRFQHQAVNPDPVTAERRN